jgi:5-hydroxyisourate hydrolase-like protein (transthyretin family)
MSSLRNIVTLLTAIVTLAFAAATNAAPVKQWSISVLPPSTFATSTNVPVTIRIKNETPNGNSNINSLKVFLPTGYTIVSAQTSWLGNLDYTSQSGVIAFSNMSPVKPQVFFDINAVLNIATGTIGCTPTAWPGMPPSTAWTGSSFSGDTFLLKSVPTTGVSPNGALDIPTVSSPVPIGTNITGKVHAASCGQNAQGVGVTVTLTNSANQTVGGPTVLSNTDTNGLTPTFQFATTSLVAGTYKITATAGNYTSATANVTVCGNGFTFTTQPSNIAAGSAVNAVVQANSCGNIASGVSVQAQLQNSSGHNVGDPVTQTTDANGNTSFSIQVADPGTYTIVVSAMNYTSATSNSFKVFAGILDCGQPFPRDIINHSDVAPDQPGYATGGRNAWNKDGVTDTQCVEVLYNFTNNIRASADPTLTNSVNLSWDTATQVNAAFQYTVNWNPVLVDTALSGWSTSQRPQVAWLDKSGNLATGSTPSAQIAWIPGLACLGNRLPVPYGTLAAALDTTIDANNESPITINNVPVISYPDLDGNTYSIPAAGSADVPPVPFPIVIPNVGTANPTDTERMTATTLVNATPVLDGNGNTTSWTITYKVRRGTAKEGDPTGSHIANHAASAKVMSTPLPIIPNDATTFPAPYKVNTQSQMCIAKHGFTSFQLDASGNTQVMYSSTIFDIGDGWVQVR